MIFRKEYFDLLLKMKDKKIIKVITGIRRCGKSTLLSEYKKYLLSLKEKLNIIFMNFDDPSYSIYLNDYKKLYDYIKSNLKSDCMNYIILDEIQNVNSFQKCVNGLYLKENVDIYITGSNSYMLSGDLATFLSGRYIEIHLLPLSFKEYISTKEEINENRLYEEYISVGGFPYIINLNNDNELIKHYLDSVYNTVVLKDIISKNNIKDVMILESLIHFIFDNIGQIVSTKKISDTLKSNGRGNSVNTIESYLTALSDSFIIYKVPRYDIKGKEYLKSGFKYYVSDLGLRNYLLGGIKDRGSILENVIFLELKRRGYDIYIGKNDNNEIDFAIKDSNGIKYIQVCESVRNEETLKRELKSLKETNDNYPKYIITLDYDNANYDGVIQISAFDFLEGKVDL